MARRYTYETTLDFSDLGRPEIGEQDVKATFECSDHELAEGVEVASIAGMAARCFLDGILSEVAQRIEIHHQAEMIQAAIEADAERWAEEQDRRDEAKAERAGWRV